LGAGLAVTGRIREIGQNILQSSFQTGISSSSYYCHVFFLIAFLEEAFIRNLKIILYNNCIIFLAATGSVLAFGTQVHGFKPGSKPSDFSGEKILSTPSFGGEVKPSVPCRALRHVKEPKSDVEVVTFGKILSAISRP
jgi:hypothetical protein